MPMTPSHALQRTRTSRPGCNSPVPQAGSLLVVGHITRWTTKLPAQVAGKECRDVTYSVSPPFTTGVEGAASWFLAVLLSVQRDLRQSFAPRLSSCSPMPKMWSAELRRGNRQILSSLKRRSRWNQPPLDLDRMMLPDKSPEPTAVGALSSAVAVHVASRRWPERYTA